MLARMLNNCLTLGTTRGEPITRTARVTLFYQPKNGDAGTTVFTGIESFTWRDLDCLS